MDTALLLFLLNIGVSIALLDQGLGPSFTDMIQQLNSSISNELTKLKQEHALAQQEILALKQELETMSTTDRTKEEQRTFLRERFLRLMAALNGQEAEVSMFEKTKVTCVLGPVDIDLQHIQVHELVTPMGIIPDAVLRSSDVISLTVPDLKPGHS
ncbi:hypothetical protein KUTeg_000760 [Tegillarca granosa]|uniref:Uncharacterized protein n=1 Tax=Tegillarca granosa TaxID=220873 RepID=A0ABQ9FYL1_TEGGR|nr:hypothetical protein KUTeg_000760 [Tegillarca granosa]